MGMSTHVVGFAPPDEKWRSMKAVWDSCESAGILAPKEVQEFFNHHRPDEAGVTVELEKHPSVKEWHAEMCDGYQIDISKLPPHVKFIRVYNSF